jgi:hypothetical protein
MGRNPNGTPSIPSSAAVCSLFFANSKEPIPENIEQIPNVARFRIDWSEESFTSASVKA